MIDMEGTIRETIATERDAIEQRARKSAGRTHRMIAAFAFCLGVAM
jgi:hypothetical protein